MPDVQSDERGLRVTREYTIARRQEFRVRRVILPGERPVRELVWLLVPFVEPIDREEEGGRIRDVDGDRQAERAARLPHGIETAVIDLHQWTGRDLLPEVQTEHLEHLHAACPGGLRAPELVGLPLRVP